MHVHSAFLRRVALISLPLLATGAPTLAAELAGGDGIEFEALGQAFRAAHCEGAETSDACNLDAIVRDHYARVTLGVFELCYPADLLAKSGPAKQFIEVMRAVLDLEARWLGIVGPGDDTERSAQKELESVRGWLSTVKPAQLARIRKSADKDLFTYLEAGADVVATQERLLAYMLDPDALFLVPIRGEPARILLAPTRREFMELVGFAGQLEPELQAVYWHEDVVKWTQIWSGWTLVLALEYAPWGGTDPKFKTGLSMKEFDKTGLSEHVVQQATLTLLRHVFAREPTHFEQALATNITIDVCGQINTVDGEGAIGTSGARTLPYSRFVPGGNPNGGVLPARSAAPFNMVVINKWRKGKGDDWFAAALRKGQKTAAKRAAKDKSNPQRKDKTPHFQLDDPNVGKHLITAPFLSEFANEKQYPPTKFLNDYREFFRSYRSCFFHWLEVAGDPESPEASKAKFKQLVRGTVDVTEEDTFDNLVATIYGVPLSASDGSTDSLEWRFLAWLAASS